jgi:hypothetical protein
VSAEADASGASIGSDADDADAGTGGTTVGADADVSADTGAGGTSVNADADVDADAGTGGTTVGADADVSAETDASGARIGADADVDADTGADGATTDVPAVAQTSSSILLPIIPLGGHQGAAADVRAIREEQLAAISCVDPLTNGPCPTASDVQLEPIPQSGVRFEIAEASEGAARLPTPTVVQSAPGARSADPRGLGISLVDPVRTSSGMVVHCIIVNTSSQTQAIPPMDVSLLNSAGQVVEHSVLRAPVDALARGERKKFRILVQPLPPDSARLTVAFTSPTAR